MKRARRVIHTRARACVCVCVSNDKNKIQITAKGKKNGHASHINGETPFFSLFSSLSGWFSLLLFFPPCYQTSINIESVPLAFSLN